MRSKQVELMQRMGLKWMLNDCLLFRAGAFLIFGLDSLFGLWSSKVWHLWSSLFMYTVPINPHIGSGPA